MRNTPSIISNIKTILSRILDDITFKEPAGEYVLITLYSTLKNSLPYQGNGEKEDLIYHLWNELNNTDFNIDKIFHNVHGELRKPAQAPAPVPLEQIIYVTYGGAPYYQLSTSAATSSVDREKFNLTFENNYVLNSNITTIFKPGNGFSLNHPFNLSAIRVIPSTVLTIGPRRQMTFLK